MNQDQENIIEAYFESAPEGELENYTLSIPQIQIDQGSTIPFDPFIQSETYAWMTIFLLGLLTGLLWHKQQYVKRWHLGIFHRKKLSRWERLKQFLFSA